MHSKFLATLFASIMLLPLASQAAEHDHGSHHATEANAPTSGQLTEATIKKIDREKGRVTLSHGPQSNGMPAMTMIFKVKDKAALKDAKQGGKALFRAETINGTLELVDFRPITK